MAARSICRCLDNREILLLNALRAAAEEAQKQGAVAILDLGHAHHAEGSVGFTNAFGNVNATGNTAVFNHSHQLQVARVRKALNHLPKALLQR